jgi:hypothetical protein
MNTPLSRSSNRISCCARAGLTLTLFDDVRLHNGARTEPEAEALDATGCLGSPGVHAPPSGWHRGRPRVQPKLEGYRADGVALASLDWHRSPTAGAHSRTT